MMKHKVDDDEDDAVVKDGQRITVRMELMDSQQREVAARTVASSLADHRPHAAVLSDAVLAHKVAAHKARDEALANRWRNPPPLSLPAVTDAKATDAKPATVQTVDHAAIYTAYDAKVAERWRAA